MHNEVLSLLKDLMEDRGAGKVLLQKDSLSRMPLGSQIPEIFRLDAEKTFLGRG